MKNIISAIRACLLVAAMIISTDAFAQTTVNIKGNIKDANGQPVIGATIMIAGTTQGALSDPDGNYKLNVTFKDKIPVKLVFSCLSYKTQTIEPNGRAVIDVVLQDDREQLDEVLVVGYGAMRKSDLTGSVTSVKIEELDAAQNASLDHLLQGKAAGVQVVSMSAAPDAASKVTIRGASSFNSGSQPLYVVDGIILNTSGSTSVGSHGDSSIDEETNGLVGINPQDIESIEVLKDASATAIYGSQGANGVVLITTKTANQEKPSINFTAGVSISNIYKKFEVLTTEQFPEYLQMKKDAGRSVSESYFKPFTEGIESGEYAPVDWQDYTTRVAVTQRYYLTVSGRPKNTQYLFSVGYFGNSGIVKGTGYSNPTMRLNLDKTIKKFTIGTKTSLSYMKSEMTQGVGGTTANSPATSLIMSMLQSRPVHKLSGETDLNTDSADMAGPDKWLTDYTSRRAELRVTPSVYAQYKFLSWLTFKSTFGADFRSNEQEKFKSIRINYSGATGSNGAVTHVDRFNWNWDNVFMFNHKFGKKHLINASLGQSASQTTTKIETVEGTNIDQWKAQIGSLNTAPYTYLTYSEGYNQILSFFGRVMYNFDERYILTATYRFDGSSRFAQGRKWAQFPSLAFAWRLSSEPWFNVPVISSAKVRLGWGKVGNQNLPSYQTVKRYNSVIVATHDTDSHKLFALNSTNLANENLKWETTTQYNVGLDLGMWKGRFTFTADFYYKLTEDLLQTKILAGSAGVSNPYVNMGSVSNKGMEFTLNVVPISTKNVEWSIGGNISFNKNRIESIDPSGMSRGAMCLWRGDKNAYEVDYFTGTALSGDAVCKDYINIFIAGQPMCLFYGMPTDGIVQEGQTGVPFEDGKERGPGAVNFLDTNQDGVISSADRVIIGDPNPDFIYGFNTNFRYKRFTLNAQFTGSYGNDIYNQQAAILSDMSTNYYNVLQRYVYDQWSPANPGGKYPSIAAVTTTDTSWCTDRYVEDGSYIRLANLSVSYFIPIRNKKAVIKRITIGATGKNLACWTNYSGYDPDVNVYGSALKYGVDSGAYPSARTYMLDLKLTF